MTTAENNDLTDWCNSQRGWYGKAAVARDWRLDAAAQAQANAMAAAQVLSHSDLSALWPQGWATLGEVVAYAWTAWDAHVALSYSPPHLAIMNGPYAYVGVGTARGAGGQLWVCEIFANV